MTISISQQPRFQRILVVLGLVAALVGATVALIQITSYEGSGADPSPAPADRATVAQTPTRFRSIQDDFLVPPAVQADEMAAAALLELQDAYLPPVQPAARKAVGAVSLQDGFLPPDGWIAPSPTPQANSLGSRGPQ